MSTSEVEQLILEETGSLNQEFQESADDEQSEDDQSAPTERGEEEEDEVDGETPSQRDTTEDSREEESEDGDSSDTEVPSTEEAAPDDSLAPEASESAAKKTGEKSCPKHHLIEQMYCEDCKLPICPACLQDGHQSHHWVPKSKYIAAIASKEEEMTEAQKTLSTFTDIFDQRIQQSDRQHSQLEDHIRSQTRRLHEAADEQQTLLLQVVKHMTSRQNDHLMKRRDIFVRLHNFFGEALQHCSLEEAAEGIEFYKKMQEEVLQTLFASTEEIERPLSAEAQVMAHLTEAPVDNIVKSIQSKFEEIVVLSQPAVASDIKVTGGGAKHAIVGLQSRFEINAIHDAAELSKVILEDMTCTLVPKDNGTVITCGCKREAPDRFSVSYIAEQPGVYSINVQMGSIGSLGLSQVVTVVPVLAYEPKVVTVKNLREPVGVALGVNSGAMIVERAGNVVTSKSIHTTRKHFGKRGSGDGQFLNPSHLAFTPDSAHFLVTDTGNHRLQKFTAKGRLVEVVGKKGSDELEFDTPTAIAVNKKGDVYVVEVGNNRIQVLNCDLSFTQFIACPKGATPTCVGVDSDGMLFVGYREHYVQKLHPNGHFILNIGTIHITSPSCLCVSQFNLIYVGDESTKNVVVFTSDGEFLYQLDNSSSSIQPAKFGKPGGVAVDSSNNLYITDPDNSRLLVLKQET